jgi:Cof subfamily protein (haloacid dehalogenase superfamily)
MKCLESIVVKMIIMDLDGTLLNDEKNVSDYTLSILKKCKDMKIKLALATARAEKSAERCVKMVKPDIMILNGGALAINSNGNVIYKRLLSIKTSDGIINECVNYKDIGFITVETDNDYYVSYKNKAYHPDYIHGKYYDFSKPLSQEAYKITAEAPNKETVTRIGGKYNECNVINFSGGNLHRFAHKEAEKMLAIEAVSAYENISIDDIAAFGDDYNDIEMIKGCGIGIAMENGVIEIKNVAKYICKSNNEDGAGKWIKENLL